LLAWTMLIFSLSMAGTPPTAGFYAKLLVLESAVAAGYIELAIFAVLMSLVGAYFYLRFIKLMFFDSASTNGAAVQPIPMSESIVLGVNGLGLLLLGLLPGPLMAFCVYAVRSSLAA
jgi:NADH-quinone oxidoreductase subunit N